MVVVRLLLDGMDLESVRSAINLAEHGGYYDVADVIELSLPTELQSWKGPLRRLGKRIGKSVVKSTQKFPHVTGIVMTGVIYYIVRQ